MDKSAAYRQIEQDFRALRTPAMPWDSALASLVALLKQNLPSVSWAGFYREDPPGSGTLWVGPYQGPIACTEIPPGKGVCGTSFARGETLIVPDVHAFPGHIACDSRSRSEIVVPVFREGRLIGVLDLDSHDAAAFDETDSEELGKLLAILEGPGESADELRRSEQGLKRLMTFIHDKISDQASRKISRLTGVELAAPRSWNDIVEKARAILNHTAAAEGKRASLHLSGPEPRLSPIAIIAVGDAFVHLIRNAVAHGIPPQGEGAVRIQTRADGKDWVIEIDDDGHGVDVAHLESQAVARGLRTPGAALRPQEAAELLFQPGFSSMEPGASAGRGVGMSAVRSSIRSVGGAVEVDLPAGSGVRVTLRVPGLA